MREMFHVEHSANICRVLNLHGILKCKKGKIVPHGT